MPPRRFTVHRTPLLRSILNVGGFNLDRALEVDPKFMEPEYPFEWAGIYSLKAGATKLIFDIGPEPSMSLVVLPVDAYTREALQAVEMDAGLWDVRLDRLVKELNCGAEWVEHIAWSDNGRLLATAAGRKLKVWTKDGELVQQYPDHPNTIAAIAWKARSEEVASACYGQLQFWSPDGVEPLRAFSWKGSMLSLAWSPDGRYLCHGNQNATVHFWVVKTGKELQMWGYPAKVRELAWDHRSRYLATGGGSSITVWDCSGKGPANTKPGVLSFHRAPVSHFAYQNAGGVLASGCDQGQLALWKPSKRKEPDAVAALPAAITGISWSPDDRLVAATAEDGGVAVFRCPERSA
jgi:WD40 repeat protein